MKKLFKMWALFVGLLGCGITYAQAGNDTLAVVTEIVSDTDTANQMDSWTFTYTDSTYEDSGVEKGITIDGWPWGDWNFGDLGKKITFWSGMLSVFFILLFFALPILIVVLICYFVYKGRKAKYEAYSRIAESGQPLPEEAVKELNTPLNDRILFNKGIKHVCVGVGLAILLGIMFDEFGIGIGALVIFVGVGELLVHYFNERDANRNARH